MNIKTLFDLANIFRHQWDAATLACLGEVPMRFRDLTRMLGIRIGERVEDNALSRSLQRLRRTHLITAEPITAGRRTVSLYKLTDKGRDLFDTYQALASTYQQLAYRTAGAKPSSRTIASQQARRRALPGTDDVSVHDCP